MNKQRVITIVEYGKLTCKDTIEETNKNIQTIKKSEIRELDEFIRDENNKEFNFLESFVKKGETLITAKNHVGVIQLKSGLTIEILPKIAKLQNDENNKITKKILLEMLKILKYFPVKQFDTANLDENKNILEIFISMFIDEVFNIVKRGLGSKYNLIENNQTFFKGRLKTIENIKHNMVHKEKFFVEYDEFNLNTAENKLIKSTLAKLVKISTDTNNKSNINRLIINYFENIENSNNFTADFEQINIVRNNKHYENVMKWCEIFLRDKGLSSYSGNTISYAFLFPMEKIFEGYVAKQLEIEYKNKKEELIIQVQEKNLFTKIIKDGKEKAEKSFILKPDILIKKNTKENVVLDTKWKALKENEKNYKIAPADMYQMYAYSKKYKTQKVILIYPCFDEKTGNFVTYKDDDKTEVKIFLFDLTYFIKENKEQSKNPTKQLIQEIEMQT